MLTPATNKTIEGSAEAARWVNTHLDNIVRIRQVLLQYFSEHGRDLLWRKTSTPYEILIAEVLLQKTGVRTVENIWIQFLERFPTIARLADASEEQILDIIRPLGLHKKASLLINIARTVFLHGYTEIPNDSNFLTSLPGIGTYTSAAIASFGFNTKAAIVDVNVARVYSRIVGFAPKTLRQGLAFGEVVASFVTTDDRHRELNFGILDFAAAICKPRPKCNICPMREICVYGQLNLSRPSQRKTDKK